MQQAKGLLLGSRIGWPCFKAEAVSGNGNDAGVP